MSSFRGVPFFTEDENKSLGRQTVVHEFVAAKDVFAEDTGPLPNRFSVEAHVIGPNFIQLRDDLEEALEEEGPGELILPNRAPITASVDGEVRISTATREGGMARFSIPFVRSGEPKFPTLDLDFGFELEAKIDFTISLLDAEDLDVSGLDFLAAAAIAILNAPGRFTAKLQRLNARISSALNVVTDLSQDIDRFSAELNTLIRSPATLSIAIKQLQNSLFNAVTSAGVELSRGDKARNRTAVALALAALSDLGTLSNEVDEVVGESLSRQQERLNQDTLLDMVEVIGISEGMRALIGIPLDNGTQAGDVVADTLEVLDAAIDRGSVNDGVDQALRDQRAAFLIFMRGQSIDLPELGTHTPLITTPALTIAWDLYQDATRDEEIVERNNLRHPGFVHGGVPLDVADV